MPSLLRIAAWPLVVKVPVFVAGLMATVAFTISQVVLWRLSQDQKSHLRVVTSAYLDGLSAAILPAIIRGDVWEVFDALDRGRRTALRYRRAPERYYSGSVRPASLPGPKRCAGGAAQSVRSGR
jgi:hypothetical protein